MAMTHEDHEGENTAPIETARVVPEEIEERLVALVDWAREFLATEVEGQYTSDAALQLALAVFMCELGSPTPTKPGDYLP